MAGDLRKQGLFVDESYIIRVLEPSIAKDSEDLKEENETFLNKITDFRKIVEEIARNLEVFATEVDKKKILAIATQNLINSSMKLKGIEQQQIQTKIIEKSLELDRLKIEVKYLQKCEMEMQEIFDKFYRNE